MASKILFDDNNSDSDGQFKISEEYAKGYSHWRKKEELAKLKDRYSSDELESSSESDEDFASETKDKAFFKVLSFLKSGNTKLYEKVPEISSAVLEPPKPEGKKKGRKSEKPMYLEDYQREVILNGNVLTNDVDAKPLRKMSLGYHEQQEKIKNSFKELIDDEEGEGELLTVKHKTNEEKESEDTRYKSWLKGQQLDINKKDANDLQHLHNYWSNSDLPENEKFLKDFFLNQRYLNTGDNDDDDDIKDADLDSDEAEVEEQETFEKKFNFRFQEPDEEYFKTYPRVIKNSLRRPDNRRKLKRTKIGERKMKEKERKKEEIKRLKNLKKEEILEKLKQIQKITGNDSLPFDEDYLEEDFDPNKYDEKMKDMFSDDFYTYPENEQKPEFSPDEDDENWDSWVPTEKEKTYWENPDEYEHPDCDVETNRDEKNSHGTWTGRKKWRLSKFAEVVNQKRPSFDPSTMSFEKYLEEYYKLDYEDLIDDIPCRFKYRTVQSNDFGLSTEEILLADDRELNDWCSIKKCVQFKTQEQELQDFNNFKMKSQNIERKQKILSSLFEDNLLNSRKKRKKRKRNKIDSTASNQDSDEQKSKIVNEEKAICNGFQPVSEEMNVNENNIKEKMNHIPNSINFEENSPIADNITKKQENNSKSMPVHKFADRNHLNLQTVGTNGDNENIETNQKQNYNTFNKMKSKKIKKRENLRKSSFTSTTNLNFDNKISENYNTFNKTNEFKSPESEYKNRFSPVGSLFSNARLMAYGINPKKFRNKEKYKPQK